MRFLAFVLLSLTLYGCGTYYKEPGSRELRALLSGKQSQCFLDCKKGVFIQAVNGEAMSVNWKTNNYYVYPGPATVLVSVADAGLYGVCALQLEALAGEEYELSHEIEGDSFVVTAFDASGTAQGSCTAKMGPAPAGATYMPIIVPVR